jgi:FAD/FMN-containing dehydrogenase
VVRLRFSDELMIMNGAYLASLLGESAAQVAWLKGELPAWVALVGVAGRELLPEEKLAARELDLTDIAQQSGLQLLPAVPGARAETVLAKLFRPSIEPYWKETAKGAFQDIFFTTTLDRTPEFIAALTALASGMGYPTQDIGVYLQPMNMGTAYHCEFSLPYDARNPKETDRTQRLFTEASEAFSGMGAYYSRPYGIWSKLQLSRDARSTITLQKLKGVFDPNGVMNPGKLAV